MAQSYASRLPRFHLMIGAAASGKSTAARILSRCLQGPGQPQLRYVSSSDIRRQLYGDSGVLGRWEEVEAVIRQQLLAASRSLFHLLQVAVMQHKNKQMLIAMRFSNQFMMVSVTGLRRNTQYHQKSYC